MKYKAGDEVLIKAKIKDMSYVDMMYVCELITEPSVCIRFKSPTECIVADKTYSDGLKDAWELAKRIAVDSKAGGIPCCDLKKMFDSYLSATILSKYTVEEALAKIEAHENKINVNDIVKVKDESGFGIVTAVCPTGIVYVLWDDGGCGDYEPCELEKTGRTAEGLDLLLRQIKE